MAAEYRWANPAATWDEIAAKVGRTRKCLWDWRQNEAWEIAFRNAGAEQIESLAPAAVAALLKAWAKGNPANALDVLRSLGFMKGEKVTVRLELEPEDVDREIERLETTWQSRQ
jgi:hypothetical protein